MNQAIKDLALGNCAQCLAFIIRADLTDLAQVFGFGAGAKGFAFDKDNIVSDILSCREMD